ncbi:MAG: lytic transglycosylase domain-containing protein, partial [bacterium]|nr:lytic transglycosylase domain-containing protein [bacterium]
MMKKFIFQLVIAIFSVILLVGQEAEPDPFTVPDILKDNVAFWKRIYTEVSLKDGLIHDRDFPLVVYKKITIGNLRGRRRRQLIRNHMNGIRHSLDIINKRPPTRWGEKEKRIAALFRRYGDMSRLKTARSRLRFQQGQRERFKLGIERSGAYLQYIRRVFKEYDIPQRIIYLPHVESSFNINAYSKVGAAGMWQFMRRTARLYMTVNYKIDERRDPFKSTVAAAKLLKSNYRAIKSWPLAITAYN